MFAWFVDGTNDGNRYNTDDILSTKWTMFVNRKYAATIDEKDEHTFNMCQYLSQQCMYDANNVCSILSHPCTILQWNVGYNCIANTKDLDCFTNVFFFCLFHLFDMYSNV